MNIAIICAAGSGKRLKRKIPKALISLNKRPIFIHCLKSFLKPQSSIDRILIMAPKSHLKKFFQLVKKQLTKKQQGKIIDIIPGGQERQFSVKTGLEYLNKIKTNPNSPVLVHNAANIFVSPGDILACLKVIKRNQAAAVAKPCPDTLRIINKKLEPIKKLNREIIWCMQTPQGAAFKILKKAHKKAKKENYLGTDELELIQRIKYPAKIIPSSGPNFKITYPQDLIIAQALLKSHA
ncbi:MAG: IspD/TarI family cytidylyltransferase [Patescibacteria group bacterium]|nr:2-C-methyl-D-erythritol 4-phosphate cytidylyltransferase [Patescibacteria group bacterium]